MVDSSSDHHDKDQADQTAGEQEESEVESDVYDPTVTMPAINSPACLEPVSTSSAVHVEPPEEAALSTGDGVDALKAVDPGRVPADEPSTEAPPAVKKARLSEPGAVVAKNMGVGPSAPARRREFRSPEHLLVPISPHPWCTIVLNYNDHRWTALFKRGVHCDEWIDELAQKSFSCSLKFDDPAHWRGALLKVHEFAWSKWRLGGGNSSEDLKLDDAILEQDPGHIDEAVLGSLAEVVSELPPKKKYVR